MKRFCFDTKSIDVLKIKKIQVSPIFCVLYAADYASLSRDYYLYSDWSTQYQHITSDVSCSKTCWVSL